MTIDAELAAVRAVARQLRGAQSMDGRRLSALSSSLDHSARGLARGVEFLRAEADGRKPPVVEFGDPDPYRGLGLAEAARLLVERATVGTSADRANAAQFLAAEVDGFITAVTASGRRTAPLAKAGALPGPGADSPGEARSGASRTSRAAALAVEPRTGSARRRVLDAVAAVARDPRTVGLTDVEIQRATGLNPNTARPRRVELVSGGWLADSGETREHYGREHTVWVLSAKAAALVAGLPRTA